jgi:hypothetical protein
MTSLASLETLGNSLWCRFAITLYHTCRTHVGIYLFLMNSLSFKEKDNV